MSLRSEIRETETLLPPTLSLGLAAESDRSVSHLKPE